MESSQGFLQEVNEINLRICCCRQFQNYIRQSIPVGLHVSNVFACQRETEGRGLLLESLIQEITNSFISHSLLLKNTEALGNGQRVPKLLTMIVVIVTSVKQSHIHAYLGNSDTVTGLCFHSDCSHSILSARKCCFAHMRKIFVPATMTHLGAHPISTGVAHVKLA